MAGQISLISIDGAGAVNGWPGGLPEIAVDVCEATTAHYANVGFELPWVCYLALTSASVVGTCGFKGPPRDGRVEIAYFTFPGFEGQGIATAMAAELIAVARKAQPAIQIAAQTLPQRNASHRILEKLGFTPVGLMDHPEDGAVCEWRLPMNQS